MKTIQLQINRSARRFPFALSLRRVNGPDVPLIYKRNFRYLVLDTAWFGVLSGSTLSFQAIYAARLGATPAQIGLLSALPALVLFLLALPAGTVLEKRATGQVVFRTAVLTRIFYLLLVPLPLLFDAHTRIWMIILFSLLMNIPGVVLGLGFNSLFAETVPMEWRAHVVGQRNSINSIITVLTTLASGQLLRVLEFPYGYQVVFLIGFIGAAMSTLYLYLLRNGADYGEKPAVPLGMSPERDESAAMNFKRVRPWSRLSDILSKRLHLDVLRGQFGHTLVVLGMFYLVLNLPAPLHPVYQVNILHFTDQTLSIGTAAYNVAIFLFSPMLWRFTRRLGNKRATGLGMVLISFFPAILTVAFNPLLYWTANFISGMGWAVGGGAIFNYILEKVPAERRPPYLAWYSLANNASVWAGSLLGPLVADFVPIAGALVLFAIMRLLTGLYIMRWG